MPSPDKLRQSVLSVPGNGSKTCSLCGMTYYTSLVQDQKVHKKHHENFINGFVWKQKVSEKVRQSFQLKDKKGNHEVKIIEIDKKNTRQKRLVESLLELVNHELNAPVANNAWTMLTDDSIQGKAFVLIVNDRAVGVCVTEPIKNSTEQGRWMVHRTQEIVSKQVNKLPVIGISRIWIASTWRRHGLALLMLECIKKFLVYGVPFKPTEIAFSQPSCAGGHLSKTFNGVKHKSGETLIPIYIEK